MFGQGTIVSVYGCTGCIFCINKSIDFLCKRLRKNYIVFVQSMDLICSLLLVDLDIYYTPNILLFHQEEGVHHPPNLIWPSGNE